MDASRVPGVDRPDTMGDPTGFGEAQVMGMRVANNDPDKMDSTLKPSSARYAGEDDGLHAMLEDLEPRAREVSSAIYPHLDDEQRATFTRRVNAHVPRARAEVRQMFPRAHPDQHHETLERLAAAKSVLHVLHTERQKLSSKR